MMCGTQKLERHQRTVMNGGWSGPERQLDIYLWQSSIQRVLPRTEMASTRQKGEGTRQCPGAGLFAGSELPQRAVRASRGSQGLCQRNGFTQQPNRCVGIKRIKSALQLRIVKHFCSITHARGTGTEKMTVTKSAWSSRAGILNLDVSEPSEVPCKTYGWILGESMKNFHQVLKGVSDSRKKQEKVKEHWCGGQETNGWADGHGHWADCT